MQNLSERYFSKKTLWLGFGEAKPNLTFFRRKNNFHLRFSEILETPSENQGYHLSYFFSLALKLYGIPKHYFQV